MSKSKKDYNAIKSKLKNKILNSNEFIPKYIDSNNVEKHSWFDIENFNYLDSKPITTNILNKSELRIEQIKLFLNFKQKNIINEWIEIARIIYNITVKYFRNNKLTSFKTVRSIIKNSFNEQLLNRINLCNMPHHVQDNAINDVIKAYKTSISLIKAKHVKCFKIRYKKINKPKQTIVIEKADFSKRKNSFYVSSLGEIISSKLFNNIEHDTRLTKVNNMYILNVPVNKKIKQNINQYEKCGIDPGNCTFLTVYNPEGECQKIFNRKNNERLKNMLKRKIKLNSLCVKTKKINKALLKNNYKIRNLIKRITL